MFIFVLDVYIDQEINDLSTTCFVFQFPSKYKMCIIILNGYGHSILKKNKWNN